MGWKLCTRGEQHSRVCFSIYDRLKRCARGAAGLFTTGVRRSCSNSHFRATAAIVDPTNHLQHLTCAKLSWQVSFGALAIYHTGDDDDDNILAACVSHRTTPFKGSRHTSSSLPHTFLPAASSPAHRNQHPLNMLWHEYFMYHEVNGLRTLRAYNYIK